MKAATTKLVFPKLSTLTKITLQIISNGNKAVLLYIQSSILVWQQNNGTRMLSAFFV